MVDMVVKSLVKFKPKLITMQKTICII
jgi:hypothetical protein